jgi:hypothetical protein
MQNYIIILCLIGSLNAAQYNDHRASMLPIYSQTNCQVSSFAQWLDESKIDLTDKSIISFECRTGELEHALANKPIQSILGVDAHKNLIDLCQKNYAGSNLAFEHSRTEDFEPQTLRDVAIAAFCFHSFQDKPKALQAISTSLKCGGEFFANIETTNDPESFAMKAYDDLLISIPLVGSLLAHLPHPTSMARLHFGPLHIMLAQAGLNIITSKSMWRDWTMDKKEWRKVQLCLLLNTGVAQHILNSIYQYWPMQKASEAAFCCIQMSPKEKTQHDAPFFAEIEDDHQLILYKIRNNDFCRYLCNKFMNLCFNHMQKNNDGTYTWRYETTLIRAEKA